MLGKLRRLAASVFNSERKLESLAAAVSAGTDTISAVVRQQSSGLADRHTHASNALLLAASDLIFAGTRGADPRDILKIPTHIYSQNYEDAIISEIFSRIGEGGRTFVEIGIEDGSQCNTRLLLECGWHGLWVEGNETFAERARERMRKYVDDGRLKIVSAMVTPTNVQEIITEALGDMVIDLFSLDIDHNTPHAWRPISSKCRVVCIEYNASVPPGSRWEVDYDESRSWDGSNYFGASLKVMEEIGKEKGLSLVGCDFHGVNAFFVTDEELGGKFIEPHTAERHYSPPRYHLIAHRGHPVKV